MRSLSEATNVCTRGKCRGSQWGLGTESLQCHLYETQTKIQNVKPNKTKGLFSGCPSTLSILVRYNILVCGQVA